MAMKTVKREEQFNRMSAHMININVMLTQKKKNYGKAAQINKKKTCNYDCMSHISSDRLKAAVVFTEH